MTVRAASAVPEPTDLYSEASPLPIRGQNCRHYGGDLAALWFSRKVNRSLVDLPRARRRSKCY
jgi:hypothetical protein